MALFVLLFSFPTGSAQAAQLAAYPPDPTADISWSGGTASVTDIESAFNHARQVENTQLGTSIPMMSLPVQAEWNGMSDGQKALWLINRERIDRGVLPLESVETNVTAVAQTYANYLIANDAWGHTEDGRSPWQRLEDNPAIGACHDFLNVAENLAVFVTDGSSIPLPIERSIYMWMYDDSGSLWGHRHAILWGPYNNDHGPAGSEGFLGIGRANGADYQGPFSRSWNYVELIVMNVFDPCANFSPPRLNSIVRAGASLTSAASVDFIVTFSESVTGVDTVGPSFDDFTLTTVGVSGATVSGISGSGSLYTVTIETGSGDGTIRLDLIDDDSIEGENTATPLGGAGAGNGDFTSGEVYTIDKTPPTVSSITRLNTNPSAARSVSFLVTFSEPVAGVEADDLALTTTGLSGAFVSNVIGSGATRTIVVNTGVGDGPIRLDVLDNDTILDVVSNPLNGEFISGEEYTIDKPDLPPPALRSPREDAVTNLTTPTFRWTSVNGGSSYEIEIATDQAFPAPAIVDGGTVNTTSFTPAAPLSEDVFYWHVRARTAGGQPGAWSAARTFTIDTTGPAAPTLISPAEGASIRTAAFRWQAVSGAAAYEFQLDTDLGFTDPIIISSIVRGTSRRLPALPAGPYNWRVRARDALGNWGAWSAPFTVNFTGP
jgi:hypothetical protein